MKETISSLLSATAEELKSNKFRSCFLAFYIVFTVFSAVYFSLLGQIRNAILPVAYAALFIVLLFLAEYFMKIHCGNVFLIILFFVPIGGILGSCFDFYMLIPSFDTILHTVSGFIFAALGYCLMERMIYSRAGSSRLAKVAFAFAFSLAIAVLWELFEWLLTAAMNGDMHEDSLTKNIYSYFLAGSHNETVNITDIEKTLVYYDGGKVYVIDGGYMDLGLFDTLVDMLVCLCGAVVFVIISLIDHFSKKKILHLFVPSCVGDCEKG